MRTTASARSDGAPRPRTRTCVGCGLRDRPEEMLRLSISGRRVVCTPPYPGRVAPAGRGAHLHPRPVCVTRASRSLARALRAELRLGPRDLGDILVTSCEFALGRLLADGRRRRLLDIGADADAPLTVVAVDAGLSGARALASAISAGRAVAWKTKNELGALLGENAVAFCAVRDVDLAKRFVWLRAAVDAGMQAVNATREGAECSRRPEAR